MNCSGDGSCLQQTDDGYEESECIHNCQPVKCVNYELCESELPQWLAYKRIQTPICINCDVSFAGPLQFINKTEECCICMDNRDLFVKFQQCTHEVCCKCFRECCGWSTDEDQSERLENCPFCRRSHLKHWERD